MVGTGLGAKRGILVKHAVALEQASTLDTVVFDKTSTLTRGEPEVVAITADGVSDDELLALVAGADAESEHPLGVAIVNARLFKREGIPLEGSPTPPWRLRARAARRSRSRWMAARLA